MICLQFKHHFDLGRFQIASQSVQVVPAHVDYYSSGTFALMGTDCIIQSQIALLNISKYLLNKSQRDREVHKGGMVARLALLSSKQGLRLGRGGAAEERKRLGEFEAESAEV
jgi:hypothetical protein